MIGQLPWSRKKIAKIFQARVGCVVALRESRHSIHDPGTLDDTPSILRWSDPILVPGREHGLALVGRWISCHLHFPTSKHHRSNQDRHEVVLLEGEVVAVAPAKSASENNFHVLLLVDHKTVPTLETFPQNDAFHFDLETSHDDRVMVHLKLPKISSRDYMDNVCRLKNNCSTVQASESVVVLHWMVKAQSHNKLLAVEAILSGIPDSEKMIVQKWIASHPEEYFSDHHAHVNPSSPPLDDNQIIIGEVIETNTTLVNAKATTMLRVKKLLLPEHTQNGRLEHNGFWELFDCDRSFDSTILVPKENVLVISSSVYRVTKGNSNVDVEFQNHDSDDCETMNHYNGPFIRYSYDTDRATFSTPLSMYDLSPLDLARCHSCKRIDKKSRLRRCSLKHDCKRLSQIELSQREHSSKAMETWWCLPCLGLPRKKRLYGENQIQMDWCCPCCSGTCRCRPCQQQKRVQCHLLSAPRTAFICNICCRPCTKLYNTCSLCSRTMHRHCQLWEMVVQGVAFLGNDKTMESLIRPESLDWIEKCDDTCRGCMSKRRKSYVQNFSFGSDRKNTDPRSILRTTISWLNTLPPVDFDLPIDFLSTKHKLELASDELAHNLLASVVSQSQSSFCETISSVSSTESMTNSMSCARSTTYQRWKDIAHNSFSYDEAVVEASDSEDDRVSDEEIENQQPKGTVLPTRHGRATRAHLRRTLKESTHVQLDVNLPKNLNGCEHNLRFGRSNIHGWGVYTDDFIKAGDFIVEYRGILIGNAVADRREKEYELARIGSDYMFRIDASTVIDATKQGNMARFINASCDPNCYTQKVSSNGMRKVAIYAKRDIFPGEELKYDYKFQSERDATKRVPCRCGSVNCRGYMNWDKRLDMKT